MAAKNKKFIENLAFLVTGRTFGHGIWSRSAKRDISTNTDALWAQLGTGHNLSGGWGGVIQNFKE